MIPYKSVWECFLIFDCFDCRPWSSLELQPLDFKGSVELLASSLNKHAVNIPQEQVGKRISIGRNRGIYFHFWGCFVRFKLILVYHDCYIIFVILILFFKHQCHCNYHFIIIFIVIFWTIRILLDILILVITIVTLPFCINPSVCIFSIQLFPHFLKCWQGEFVF